MAWSLYIYPIGSRPSLLAKSSISIFQRSCSQMAILEHNRKWEIVPHNNHISFSLTIFDTNKKIGSSGLEYYSTH